MARNGAIKSINDDKKERRRACASAIPGITKYIYDKKPFRTERAFNVIKNTILKTKCDL